MDYLNPFHFLKECAKAFVVLSSEFQNKEENEMISELQDHMMKNAAAWMKPAKVRLCT